MFCKFVEFNLRSFNTTISVRKNKIIYDEPTIAAIDLWKNKIIAVGNEAKKLKGRCRETIKVIEPIKDGGILDVNNTVKMLKYILKKANIKLSYNAVASVVVSIDSTQMDYMVLEYIFKDLGFSKIQTKYVSERFSQKDEDMLILTTDSSKTELVFFSFNKVLTSYKVVNSGREEIRNKLKNIMEEKYSIIVGENEIERIIKIIDTPKNKNSGKIITKGKDKETLLPKIIEIDLKDVRNIINDEINLIVDTAKDVFKTIPNEMKNEIKGKNLVFVDNGFDAKNLLADSLKKNFEEIKE